MQVYIKEKEKVKGARVVVFKLSKIIVCIENRKQVVVLFCRNRTTSFSSFSITKYFHSKKKKNNHHEQKTSSAYHS